MVWPSLCGLCPECRAAEAQLSTVRVTAGIKGIAVEAFQTIHDAESLPRHRSAAAGGRIVNHDWNDSRSFDRYTLLYTTAERPLSADSRQWLVQGLTRAMPELKVSAYFEAKKNWFSEYDYLIVAVERGSDDVIGVLASSWHLVEGRPFFLHIIVQFIAPRYQKSLLLKHMWAFHFGKVSLGAFGFPSVIALRTYNPVVYTAMRIFSGLDGVELYPRIGAAQDPTMVELARRVAERISGALDISLDTGVIRGASVPPDFYPALPKTNRMDVLEYFERHLAPSDRLLCILSVPTDIAKSRILRAFGA